MSDEAFIIYYSKYSNACLNISDKINFIAPHFNITIIDIDNPQVRQNIVNATVNKITKVPSIMLFMPNEKKLEIHEGQKAINIIDKAVYMVNQKLHSQRSQQEQQTYSQPETPVENNTRIQSQQIRKSSSYGKYSSLEDVLEGDLPYDQGEVNHKKVGKGINNDPRFAKTNKDKNMISTVGENPVYGEGHDDMRSTLSEFGKNSQQKTYKPMGPDFDKKINSIESIDDIHSEEQYTDSLIKPEDTIGLRMDEILAPENSSNSNKESNRKSSAVKMAAEQIAREREMSDKK
jgi:hypothetical protein